MEEKGFTWAYTELKIFYNLQQKSLGHLDTEEKIKYLECREHGIKKKSESPIEIEPTTFRTPVVSYTCFIYKNCLQKLLALNLLTISSSALKQC